MQRRHNDSPFGALLLLAIVSWGGGETLEAPCARIANRRTSVPGAIGRMTRLEGASSLLKPTVAATLVTRFTRPACRTRTRRQLPRNGRCIPKCSADAPQLAQLGVSLHTWSLAVALHSWLCTHGSAHTTLDTRLCMFASFSPTFVGAVVPYFRVTRFGSPAILHLRVEIQRRAISHSRD